MVLVLLGLAVVEEDEIVETWRWLDLQNLRKPSSGRPGDVVLLFVMLLEGPREDWRQHRAAAEVVGYDLPLRDAGVRRSVQVNVVVDHRDFPGFLKPRVLGRRRRIRELRLELCGAVPHRQHFSGSG